MFDSDYYPAGAANDPRAPYNQVEAPEQEFDVQIMHTFYVEPTITTDNYGGYGYEGEAVEDFKNQYTDVQSAMQYCIKLLLDRIDTLKAQGMQMRIERNGKGRVRWVDMKLKRESQRLNAMIETLNMYANAETEIEEQ